MFFRKPESQPLKNILRAIRLPCWKWEDVDVPWFLLLHIWITQPKLKRWVPCTSDETVRLRQQNAKGVQHLKTGQAYFTLLVLPRMKEPCLWVTSHNCTECGSSFPFLSDQLLSFSKRLSIKISYAVLLWVPWNAVCPKCNILFPCLNVTVTSMSWK